MRISVNDPCPCHSGQPYKKCCRKYHNGPAAPTAELLMRARYSAYSLGLASFIRETTHPAGPHYQADRKSWEQEILDFCLGTSFDTLDITEVVAGETESYVTFYLTVTRIRKKAKSGERSRFFLVDGRWLYHSGETFPAQEL